MLGRVIVIFFFGWAGLIQVCLAAASLSASPIDGGDTLRFEQMSIAGLENSKEVQIRVSSNHAKRYQVFQKVLESNLQVIETQVFPFSNASGTLQEQVPVHLSLKDQLLYTSSQDAQDDSFIVKYFLNNNFINTGGNLTGKIVFTLRFMDGSVPKQVGLNVLLDNSLVLNVSVTGGYEPARVNIRDFDTKIKTADFVKISFSGNKGQKVRVYQELESPLQNEMAQKMDMNALQIAPQVDKENLHVWGVSPLIVGRTFIYSSSRDEDSFLIYFLVDPNLIDAQDAGSYVGRIKYVVETNTGPQEFPMNIQCAVQPVFTMDVTMPPGGVSFSQGPVNALPQEQEVTVMVTTNLHKQYQVLQNFQKDSDKHFLMKVNILPDEQGYTDFTDFSPVRKGEYPVFYSNAQGAPTAFKVVYRLEANDKTEMGNFLVPVSFSLRLK